MDMKAQADAVFEAMKEFIAKKLLPFETRLAALEDRPLEKGEKGESGKDGIDGKSITIDDIRGYLDAEISAWALSFERRAQETVARTLERLELKDGRDGRDGEPGRDAAQLDVLPGIDPKRRYQRGTYATHQGGLVRSFRSTDPLESGANLDACGWQVVVNGVGGLTVEQLGERSFAFSARMTEGETVVCNLAIPTMIYREIFKEGTGYDRGDCVTYGGSLWIAQKDAPQGKPGSSSDWRLIVKKGRDGSDLRAAS